MTERWQASFITAADHTGEPDAPAPYLRKEITVDDGLVRATLHVTALGLVEAHLNGAGRRRRGAGTGLDVLPAPAGGEHPRRHRPRRRRAPTPSARSSARAGPSAGSAGQDRRQIWADRPAAFLQLELDYGDRTEVIGTDTTWRAGTGAVLANSLYDGEDLRRPPRAGRLEPTPASTTAAGARSRSSTGTSAP